MTTPLIVGLSIAATAYTARTLIHAYSKNAHHIPKITQKISSTLSSSLSGSTYYRGGFEASMSKREAALILGVREMTPKDKIKEAHRRIMLLNHPDRGGSPYLASKINEAKNMLEKGRR